MSGLDSLLPEMLGEIRQWLDVIDRVHLQRTCVQFYALDPGPVRLPSTWQAVWEYVLKKSPDVISLFKKMVDAGLIGRVGPSAWDTESYLWTVLRVQWFQLPTRAMKHMHPFECLYVDELEVKEEVFQYPEVTDEAVESHAPSWPTTCWTYKTRKIGGVAPNSRTRQTIWGSFHTLEESSSVAVPRADCSVFHGHADVLCTERVLNDAFYDSEKSACLFSM